MNRTLNIAFTCFFGALTGTLVTLQLSPGSWYLGVLSGGLIGYLAYEPIFVGQAVLLAAQTIGRQLPEQVKLIKFAFNMVMLVMAGFIGGLPLSWSMMIGSGVPLHAPYPWLVILILASMVSLVCLALIVQTFCVWTNLGKHLAESYDRKIPVSWLSCESMVWNDLRSALKAQTVAQALATGIFGAVLPLLALAAMAVWAVWVLVTSIPAGGRFLARTAWAALQLTGRFIKLVFIRIHSEPRLLCACDAALGTVGGYYYANALIGGLIGAGLGVLNYRLVSIRWLKLNQLKV